nr:hypothetical protein [Campylobacter sp. 2018MI13]
MYYSGIGVAKDIEKTKELWTKACDNKNGESCLALSSLYENDIKKSIELIKKACDYGEHTSCLLYKKINKQ